MLPNVGSTSLIWKSNTWSFGDEMPCLVWKSSHLTSCDRLVIVKHKAQEHWEHDTQLPPMHTRYWRTCVPSPSYLSVTKLIVPVGRHFHSRPLRTPRTCLCLSLRPLSSHGWRSCCPLSLFCLVYLSTRHVSVHRLPCNGWHGCDLVDRTGRSGEMRIPWSNDFRGKTGSNQVRQMSSWEKNKAIKSLALVKLTQHMRREGLWKILWENPLI